MFKHLLILVRTMHLFYQNAHHHVGGPNFFADHEAFNSFYEDLAKLYDEVAERAIGVFGDHEVNIYDITSGIAETFKHLPPFMENDNRNFFISSMGLEKELCSMCSDIRNKVDDIGLHNFLEGICDDSQVRQYKIGRRLT